MLERGCTRWLLGSVALAAMVSGASAADISPVESPILTPVAATNWTGFYGGVQAGYGWGDAELTFNTANEAGHFWPMDQDLSGGVFGAQIGYDVNYGNIVLGIVGDYSWANIGGSSSIDKPPDTAFKTDLDGIFTLRARAGMLVRERTLAYAHGGFASGKFTVTGPGDEIAPKPAAEFETLSSWKSGAVAGVGVEHMLTNNISLFAEYSYFWFADPDLSLLIDEENSFDYKGALNNLGRSVNVIKVGANYRFNGGVHGGSSGTGFGMAYDSGAWPSLYGGVFGAYGFGNAGIIYSTHNDDGDFWTLDHSLSGGLGGVLIGYDHTSGPLVLGVVGDLAFGSISGSKASQQDGAGWIGAGSSHGGPPSGFSTKLESVATIRLRGGMMVTDKTLAYAHGGLAFGKFTLSGDNEGGPDKDFHESDWTHGFVAGLGIEQLVTSNVSLFAEYSYFNFGDAQAYQNRSGGFKGVVRNTGRNINLFKIGANYRIN